MSTLQTDVTRVYELGDVNELPVAEHVLIYEGACVGDNGDGYVRPLQAGDPFRGFADRRADNRHDMEGVKTVRIRKHGTIVLPLPGATIADVGKAIYASDDNTFTLEAEGNSFIGRIARLDSDSKVLVDFNASLSLS